MAIGEEETQNSILDAWLGPDRATGVGIPSTYEIELWSGDPRDDGSFEVTGDGYAPVAWDTDDWGPAAGGETATTGPVEWTLTAGLDDQPTHWFMRNPVSGLRAYSAHVSGDVVAPLGAGTYTVHPVVPWADPD